MPKDWNPDKPDPDELQERAIKVGEELLQKMNAQEAEERRRREEHAAASPVVERVYQPPSFEEVQAVLKRAWDGVEAIMPTAPGRVKAIAFQTLTHAAAPPSSLM
jgi:hypothetical protein